MKKTLKLEYYLALRSFGSVRAEETGCLPEKLEVGKFYKFSEEGMHVYPLLEKIDLVRVNEEGELAETIAKIEITAETQFPLGGILHTNGEYIVREVSNSK